MANAPTKKLGPPGQSEIVVDAYLYDCVNVEPEALQEEFVRIPADLAYWNERYAQAHREHLLAKLDAERAEALADIPQAEREQLLQTLAPMMRDIQDSVDGLSELRDRPAGTIRITTVEHAAKTILTPILTGFLGDYPDITVEVIVDYGLADIVADRFDAGIRLGDSVAQDMVSLPLTEQTCGALLPQQLADLIAHARARLFH